LVGGGIYKLCRELVGGGLLQELYRELVGGGIYKLYRELV